MGNTDWETLQRRFEGFSDILRLYDLPSQEEFERLKLSMLTYGQIKSTYHDNIDYGVRLYADDEDTFYLLDEVANRLGFNQEKRSDWISPFDIVREDLAKRKLTPEFVHAWGTLEFCSGVMCALIRRDDATFPEFQRKLKGSKTKAVVQQHWYAHWMARNVPSFETKAREDENLRLIILCEEIARGDVAPWPPYPREWFNSLLAKDGGDLNSSLLRLRNPDLRRMIQHPLLTPKILPPLCAEEFDRVRI